jgi:hypothetical protein
MSSASFLLQIRPFQILKTLLAMALGTRRWAALQWKDFDEVSKPNYPSSSDRGKGPFGDDEDSHMRATMRITTSESWGRVASLFSLFWCVDAKRRRRVLLVCFWGFARVGHRHTMFCWAFICLLCLCSFLVLC